MRKAVCNDILPLIDASTVAEMGLEVYWLGRWREMEMQRTSKVRCIFGAPRA